MGSYYLMDIEELESIRAMIKHGEPHQVDLERIREFLGHIRGDLDLLASLQRPDIYTLWRLPDGQVEITFTIITDEPTSEDFVQKFWVEPSYPVSDVPPAAAPTPQVPSSTPQSPPE